MQAKSVLVHKSGPREPKTISLRFYKSYNQNDESNVSSSCYARLSKQKFNIKKKKEKISGFLWQNRNDVII